MKNAEILNEAKRLYRLGFGVLLLHPKSKRPKISKWTSGPRQPWQEIEKSFSGSDNVGVRLGEASKIGDNYLACIDVDIKNPDCRDEALAALAELVGDKKCPEVRSGSGNGSRHLYCVTAEPFKMITVAKVKDKWEICVYSTGRQMVLAGSIHPDTGKPYTWKRPVMGVGDLPLMDFSGLTIAAPLAKESQEVKESTAQKLENFEVVDVDLEWLPLTENVRQAIMTGFGVKDRSGYLLRASNALLAAGLTANEVLSVLTDRRYYLGKTGYEHAGNTNNRATAAAWVYRFTLARVMTERDPKTYFGPASELKPLVKIDKEKQAAQSLEIKEMRHWTEDLERSGKNGEGPPKPTINNVVLIFKNEVSEAMVRRNTFALRDAYIVDTPWGGKKDKIVADDDVANIRYWFGKHWGFEPKKDTVYDSLTVIACQNAYDPVMDWLDGLEPWDKIPRLDTWLADNFEATGDPEYLAQVFRKWMFAMVMRVYRPGAKFDWMPIFEGAQGVGKSSFGRLLVGDAHFLDWLPNLNDKDSALSLQGMWGVEMGELSQFRKNELENTKAFLTRTVDKLRPPYGRKLMESPRRCVFFGTTNRSTYLTDDTGNRRFKPVNVGRLNFKALKKERDQLFAEAKWLFDNKKETELSLELTGKAKIFEKEIHGEKTVDDESTVMLEAMQNFIEKVEKNEAVFNFQNFKILELFTGSGPLTNWKADNRNCQFAAKMLKNLNGKREKSNGKRYWKLLKGAGGQTDPDPADFY